MSAWTPVHVWPGTHPNGKKTKSAMPVLEQSGVPSAFTATGVFESKPIAFCVSENCRPAVLTVTEKLTCWPGLPVTEPTTSVTSVGVGGGGLTVPEGTGVGVCEAATVGRGGVVSVATRVGVSVGGREGVVAGVPVTIGVAPPVGVDVLTGGSCVDVGGGVPKLGVAVPLGAKLGVGLGTPGA